MLHAPILPGGRRQTVRTKWRGGVVIPRCVEAEATGIPDGSVTRQSTMGAIKSTKHSVEFFSLQPALYPVRSCSYRTGVLVRLYCVDQSDRAR